MTASIIVYSFKVSPSSLPFFVNGLIQTEHFFGVKMTPLLSAETGCVSDRTRMDDSIMFMHKIRVKCKEEKHFGLIGFNLKWNVLLFSGTSCQFLIISPIFYNGLDIFL